MKTGKLGIMFFCTLLLITAVSCSQTQQPDDVVIEWENTSTDGKIDLDGYTATIIQHGSDPTNVFAYKDNTEFSDLVLRKVEETEQALNCVIDLTAPKSYDSSALFMSILANLKVGDIFFGSVHTFKYAEIFEPLTGLEEIIDYTDTEKWGKVSIMESLLIDSEPYGVTPTSWPFMEPAVCYVMISNDRLIREFGMDDPREKYEQGIWNWDTFLEYIGNCTDETRGIHSAAIQPGNLLKIAILSNGVSYLTEDNSGNVTGNLFTDATIEAIAWTQNFYNNYSDKLDNPGPTYYPSWEAISQPFIDKVATFCMTSTGMVINNIVYNMDESFAVLPFPSGPNAPEGYWGGILEGNNAVAIMKNTDDIEAAANIINYMFTPLEGYETTEDKTAYYLHQLLFNPQDAEVLFGIDSNALYSYWPIGADTSFWGPMNGSLFSKTPQQMLDENYPVFESIIEEYIIPNYDYVKSHSNS